jgi:clan AA aspartic protease
MGETKIRVSIKSRPEDANKIVLEAAVDAGATYSWIPRTLMAKLGIRPSRRVKFKTIEGRVIERDVGHLFIEWNGETAPTTIVFAEEGDQTVIGLHALESLGLEVDPVTREVRKSEALLALCVCHVFLEL